jgi:hypothetical protein
MDDWGPRVSVALFDLGQRLRAATLARPVARSTFAPVLPPIDPIAVTLAGTDDGALLKVTDGTRVTVGAGPDALSALVELGVAVGPNPRTLVIADRDTLSRLVELARSTDPASSSASSAAVVGWWSQRADHPGTGAVLNVTAACSARWALGVPPDDEREVSVWRTWLGIADAGPRGLLELANLVAAGQTLPGLETYTEDDQHAWESYASRLNDTKSPWDWRRRDNRRQAALGLATRCDAAELYESLRLGDPLVATRELLSGTVVTGTITNVSARTRIQVTLDHLACRLRENAAIEGYLGFPRDTPTANGRGPWLHGRVAATRVTSDERLVITIADAVVRPGPARIGQRVTLRPRTVDPRQQRSGRHELHRRYALRRSWLSGGAPPTPRRREVPLDVVVAAAE